MTFKKPYSKGNLPQSIYKKQTRHIKCCTRTLKLKTGPPLRTTVCTTAMRQNVQHQMSKPVYADPGEKGTLHASAANANRYRPLCRSVLGPLKGKSQLL